ncbi:hypothetical protein RN001_010126 [Aquatica leii]|uniref:Uncharacterized protein n=1 Tax=Aquatica leii TaxID=1421715 RepID=A0AAN7SQ68_9COLE|nr:hypothetical protein RN001_010126 [Aquatica leii]
MVIDTVENKEEILVNYNSNAQTNDNKTNAEKKNINTSIRISALAAILEPGFSVQEALEMILADDEEEFESDFFIAPPEPSLVSDEDSGDEDSGGDFNNFNRNQLLADAELRPRVLTDLLPDTDNMVSMYVEL